MKTLTEKGFKHRVITIVDRKELEYLDKIGREALYSTGHKLPYGEILRGLIDFMLEIGLSGNNIDSQNTLKERLKGKVIPEKTETTPENKAKQGGQDEKAK